MNLIRTTALIAVISLLAVSCGDTDESSDPRTAVVEGRITQNEMPSAERVELFTIGANGELVSQSATNIGSETDYAIGFDLDDSLLGEQDLVVKAYDVGDAVVGQVAAKRVVSEDVTIIMAPINTETSVEAELTVAAQQAECTTCDVEFVRAHVNAVAADELADAEAGELVVVTEAIIAQAQTREDIYDELGIQEELRRDIDDTIESAAATRDEGLAIADNTTDAEAVKANFRRDRISAYLDSEVDASTSARILQGIAAAAQREATGSDNRALNSMWSESELDAVDVVTDIIESETYLSEDARQDVIDAGERLGNDVRVLAQSEDPDADIQIAWRDYGEVVRAQRAMTYSPEVLLAIQDVQYVLEEGRDNYITAVASGENIAETQQQLFDTIVSDELVGAIAEASGSETAATDELTLHAHLAHEGAMPEIAEVVQ